MTTTELLKSSDPDNEDNLLGIFESWLPQTYLFPDWAGIDRATAVYEHGQWWITHPSGASWSVVDAEGGDAVDGYSFESISDGEDD